MATRAKGKEATPRRGLTPARRAKALAAMRDSGIFSRVAESLGVPFNTLHSWMVRHPDFRAEMDVIRDEIDQRVGQKAVNVLEHHLDNILEGRPVKRRRQAAVKVQGGGESIEWLEEEETPEINPALVKMGLTKLDPRWTHPKQEHEVTLNEVEKVWNEMAEPSQDKTP